MKKVIGIDIGGTKVAVGLGNEKGEILQSERLVTRELGESGPGLEKIAEVVRAMGEFDAIGIAAPGPVDAGEGKLLNPPNLVGWNQTPLKAFFTEAFGCEVVVNNDANAAALAEWKFGGHEGCESLIYLTCSTGMGGGIIVRGEILQGVTDTAGEVGHFVLDASVKEGTFEHFTGGKYLALKMREEIARDKIQTEVLAEAGGDLDKVSMTTLVAAVRKKDPYALKVWDEYAMRCAQGMGILIQTLNPDKMILGTIAIAARDLFLTPLQKYLPKFAWQRPIDACDIRPSELGPQIGLLGAISLAL